jgi:hypothetical protein
MQELEHAIRERAYQLWIESGCQDGHATAHCLAAQREVLSPLELSLGSRSPTSNLRKLQSEKSLGGSSALRAVIRGTRNY